ncbi:MAG: tetratricopeptide repeat protein [Bacteroidetes bacterium]|nr:tetratricopeptide repeat protein [Bacteroidota bacterium]
MATPAEIAQLLDQAFALRYENPQQTCTLAGQALELANAGGDAALLARAHRILGIGHIILCNFSEAIAHLQEAYTRYQKLNDPAGLIETASNIGASYQKMGNYALALEWDLLALKMATDRPPDRVAANTQLNIATVYYKLGQYDPALKYAHISHQAFIDLQELHGIAISLSTLGNCWEKKGDLPQALEWYQQAEVTARKADNPGTLAPILQGMGLINQLLGKDGKALLCYWEALGLQEDIGDRQAISSIYTDMCHMHAGTGSYEEAQKYGELALSLALQIGNPENEYQAHKALSRVYEQMGEAAQALHHYKQYHRLQREVIGVQTRMRFSQDSAVGGGADTEQQMDLLRTKNLEAEQLVYQKQLEIEALKDRNETLSAALKQIQQIQQVAFANEADLLRTFPDAFLWQVPAGAIPHTWIWMDSREDRHLLALFESERPDVASNTLMAMMAHMFRQILNVHPLSSAAELLHFLEAEVRAHEDWVRILVANPLYTALLVIDKGMEELQYAAYGIPLHLFSGGKQVELKGEPMPLGAKGSGKRKLQTRNLPLEDVDRLYLWNHGLGHLPESQGYAAVNDTTLLQSLIAFKGRHLQSQRHEIVPELEERLKDPRVHTDACLIGLRLDH